MTNDPRRHMLCLATEKGLASLQEALKYGPASDLSVVTFQETGVVRSYTDKITALAQDNDCHVFEWQDFADDPVEFIDTHHIRSALCVGWRCLMPDVAVNVMGGRVVIAHDSLLPKLRGFAPLPTAMILGYRTTGVTFFHAGQSVDSGPILWQTPVSINSRDTISAVIKRMLPSYRTGTRMYMTDDFGASVPQVSGDATYSIWRDDHDYRIDWSAKSCEIDRLVRAVGDPYLGAKTQSHGQPNPSRVLRVPEAEVVDDVEFELRQPGKVWRVDAGCPVVICGHGMLKLTKLTNLNGKDALPIKLRTRFV